MDVREMYAAEPLDVWLRFDAAETMEPELYDGGESTAEANTYKVKRGHGGGFVVEWYLTAVGQVTRYWCATRREARDWLESEGFQDFTVIDA